VAEAYLYTYIVPPRGESSAGCPEKGQEESETRE